MKTNSFFLMLLLILNGSIVGMAQTDISKAPAFTNQETVQMADCHYVVAQDGSGNFRTVQEAIDAVTEFC